MTGQEIIEAFYGLAGDEDVSETQALFIANLVKDQVDEDRPWEYRKIVNASQSRSSGDTWETSKPLPDDFAIAEDVIYVGDEPYYQVPFSKLRSFKDTQCRFAVDIVSGVYYLTGGATGTIRFHYLKTTADIELDEELEWPERMHKLLPPMMAEMQPAIENMERGRSWDDKWFVVAERYLSAMRRWDVRLKVQATKHAPNDNGSESPNRIDE